MYGPDVYKMVGGDVAEMAAEHGYENACALRVSVALNGAGFEIPAVAGTYTGADGKNYFLGAAPLERWLTDTFGPADVIARSNFAANLAGTKGVYVMIPNYPGAFGASGHATLFNGSSCVGGHCYFDAAGGTNRTSVWRLP